MDLKLAVLALLFGLLLIGSAIGSVSFVEDWESQNFDQWYINPSSYGDYEIIALNGNYVAEFSGASNAWTEFFSKEPLTYGDSGFAHMGFDIMFWTVPTLSEGSSYYWVAGLSPSNDTAQNLALGFNTEGELTTFYEHRSGSNITLCDLELDKWYSVDLYFDTKSGMGYWVLDDILLHTHTFNASFTPYSVDSVDYAMIGLSYGSSVGSGEYDYVIDNIVIDDAGYRVQADDMGISNAVIFGIGLLGAILIFSSWIVAYMQWKDGAYAHALAYWVALFTIGFGLITVLIGA